MSDVDIVVIGGGHNGLVTAALLARAGLSVCVLERRGDVGGAAATEELVPGCRMDVGGSVGTGLGPIVEELDLGRFGLRLVDLDPVFFAPHPSGACFYVHRSVDRTCESIARVSPRDADRYRAFMADAMPFTAWMVEAMSAAPSPRALAASFARRRPVSLRLLPRLAMSADALLRDVFESPAIQGTIGLMAAQVGLPLHAPGTAAFALTHALYHLRGAQRPLGGIGAFPRALAACVRAHGGRVETSAPVARILREGQRVIGVALASGETIGARRAVVAATHFLTTTELLGDADLSRRARRLALGNGLGMAVRLVTSALPRWSAAGEPDAHRAVQLLCPDLDVLGRARRAYDAGEIPAEQAIVMNTFSAIDPTLAPAGRHVVSLWGIYVPYRLARGEHDEAAKDAAADQMIAVVDRFAPGFAASVVARHVQSPVDLERVLALPRANLSHLDMRPDQTFFLRPLAGLARYRTPFRGLYLTGASTHPGGGIMGMAGRNAARAILDDGAESASLT